MSASDNQKKIMKSIKNALISVYAKTNLLSISAKLTEMDINIFSTGGTHDYLQANKISVRTVEGLTHFPHILGGRVKTLHPYVFGGILARRSEEEDIKTLQKYKIPEFDLVVVDLYPFEQTVSSGASEQEIIEKIDIGGVSLLRAAAKNYQDVVTLSGFQQYDEFLDLMEKQNGEITLEQRKIFAMKAFQIVARYDYAIYSYFSSAVGGSSLQTVPQITLRYGENPHQKAVFFGNFEEMFSKIHGKEISYNNLLDIDAAVALMSDIDTTPTFAILKHNNTCGCAIRPTLLEAWEAALAGDPISAFGGILITNAPVDLPTAQRINELFFEIIIAPQYQDEALKVLRTHKNRIILMQKSGSSPEFISRTLLNGRVEQERDNKKITPKECRVVTTSIPTNSQVEDLLFANILVKHSKSNAIVLVANGQMIGSGVGQTSRVDALKQAIAKAEQFGFTLKNAVMASDAFFPFADCVQIAHEAGIVAVIQPGGSLRDQESIDYCNQHNISMMFTGIRHFKH